MRGGRLNGRYGRPEVAIQSKWPTNIGSAAPKNYGPVHYLSAMRPPNVRRGFLAQPGNANFRQMKSASRDCAGGMPGADNLPLL
jgi:hypothetical protein